MKVKDMSLQEWCEKEHIDGGAITALQILKALEEEHQMDATKENDK